MRVGFGETKILLCKSETKILFCGNQRDARPPVSKIVCGNISGLTSCVDDQWAGNILDFASLC